MAYLSCCKTRAIEKSEPLAQALRWMWARGGSRLFGLGGVEYLRVGTLDRVEVERLLALGELDAVRVDCGGGISEWVGPSEVRRRLVGFGWTSNPT